MLNFRNWTRNGIKLTLNSNALYLLSFLASCGFIFFKLDPYMVDQLGHFASAKLFKNGLFHSYSVQFLSGWVHGLFYPPGEDILISFFMFLFKDQLALQKAYYCFLLSFFFYSVYKLSLTLPMGNSRSLFAFLFLILFFTDKERLGYQGLGFIDLVNTGLSSQFLGTAFLFLYLSDLKKKIQLKFCLQRV